MKMPNEAREVFDELLVLPLGSTRALKRRFASWAGGLDEADSGQVSALLGRVLSTTQSLLESIERKTSPLYVRLIHALAEYLMSEDRVQGDSLDLTARVVNSVAHSTRRFYLKFEI
jgi:hypothetical protein